MRWFNQIRHCSASNITTFWPRFWTLSTILTHKIHRHPLATDKRETFQTVHSSGLSLGWLSFFLRASQLSRWSWRASASQHNKRLKKSWTFWGLVCSASINTSNGFKIIIKIFFFLFLLGFWFFMLLLFPSYISFPMQFRFEWILFFLFFNVESRNWEWRKKINIKFYVEHFDRANYKFDNDNDDCHWRRSRAEEREKIG